MRLIKNILFPVDFTASCVAMACYVRRAAILFGANVSLMYAFDPATHNGFELYLMRRPEEIAEEHQMIGRDRLNSFLQAEFPMSQYPRIVVAGDAATQIAETAKNGFDLIVMSTHASVLRRTLIGSTTAKVLNDADRPVIMSGHAETIAPRPLEHRELLCAIGLDEDSERVHRYAHQIAAETHSNLHIIHAIESTDSDLPIQLGLDEQIQSEERKQARQRIADLQRRIGFLAPVRIVTGPIKKALLEAARQFDTDALMIGRGRISTTHGPLRDLTYAIVRDSPFPVLSI